MQKITMKLLIFTIFISFPSLLLTNVENIIETSPTLVYNIEQIKKFIQSGLENFKINNIDQLSSPLIQMDDFSKKLQGEIILILEDLSTKMNNPENELEIANSVRTFLLWQLGYLYWKHLNYIFDQIRYEKNISADIATNELDAYAIYTEKNTEIIISTYFKGNIYTLNPKNSLVTPFLKLEQRKEQVIAEQNSNTIAIFCDWYIKIFGSTQGQKDIQTLQIKVEALFDKHHAEYWLNYIGKFYTGNISCLY